MFVKLKGHDLVRGAGERPSMRAHFGSILKKIAAIVDTDEQ